MFILQNFHQTTTDFDRSEFAKSLTSVTARKKEEQQKKPNAKDEVQIVHKFVQLLNDIEKRIDDIPFRWILFISFQSIDD